MKDDLSFVREHGRSFARNIRLPIHLPCAHAIKIGVSIPPCTHQTDVGPTAQALAVHSRSRRKFEHGREKT